MQMVDILMSGLARYGLNPTGKTWQPETNSDRNETDKNGEKPKKRKETDEFTAVKGRTMSKKKAIKKEENIYNYYQILYIPEDERDVKNKDCEASTKIEHVKFQGKLLDIASNSVDLEDKDSLVDSKDKEVILEEVEIVANKDIVTRKQEIITDQTVTDNNDNNKNEEIPVSKEKKFTNGTETSVLLDSTSNAGNLEDKEDGLVDSEDKTIILEKVDIVSNTDKLTGEQAITNDPSTVSETNGDNKNEEIPVSKHEELVTKTVANKNEEILASKYEKLITETETSALLDIASNSVGSEDKEDSVVDSEDKEIILEGVDIVSNKDILTSETSNGDKHGKKGSLFKANETETKSTYYKQLMHMIGIVDKGIREEIKDRRDTESQLVFKLIVLLQEVKEIKKEAPHDITEADMIPIHIQVEEIKDDYMNLCYTLLKGKKKGSKHQKQVRQKKRCQH